MSVDLSKLIARKTYFVPVKTSGLFETISRQLLPSDMWLGGAERTRSGCFITNYREKYARLSVAREEKPMKEKHFAAKRREYDKNPFKCHSKVQEWVLNNVPSELSYVVMEERADGSIVDVTCKPMLYFKITRRIDYELSDLQDVRIRGEEFLDQVFIGGLGGKEVRQVKDVSASELLINDIHHRQITERIYKMLQGATTCVLLMGWVGTELLPKLKELTNVGVTVRAITHKPSELKAPVPRGVQKGYTELTKLIGLSNVSVNPLLHGRGIIVDNKAMVGSMDFNAHSLSGGHVEFALYTEDVDIVRILRSYFDKMFKPLKK